MTRNFTAKHAGAKGTVVRNEKAAALRKQRAANESTMSKAARYAKSQGMGNVTHQPTYAQTSGVLKPRGSFEQRKSSLAAQLKTSGAKKTSANVQTSRGSDRGQTWKNVDTTHKSGIVMRVQTTRLDSGKTFTSKPYRIFSPPKGSKK